MSFSSGCRQVPAPLRAVLIWSILSSVLPIHAARAQLRATLVVEGLTKPVGFVQHPLDSTVQIVLEQSGRARVLRAGRIEGDFLDLRGQTTGTGEQGLLGLAFAPDYASSGRVFVSFTNLVGDSVVARFVRSTSDPLKLDPATRLDLRWPDGQRFIAQPFSNHNGGHVAFGPDGYLYLGFGDGGSGDDPGHRAQNPGLLLGKMLRIDVNVPASDPQGYVVPATNPFVTRAGVRGEIWASGLRNPWRWSFDDVTLGGTGALVIADVGQASYEEVNYEPRDAGGRNYGWRNREGAHEHVTTLAPSLAALTDPILEYPPTSGKSITGGYVYRGRALGSSYRGRYFFGDYVSGRIWSVGLSIDPLTREARVTSTIEHSAELSPAATSISSFGADAQGELYVVTHQGRIYRIDGNGEIGEDTGNGVKTRRRTTPAIGQAQPRTP
jgi:glucose/arabinose dehydrogenase